MKAWLRLALIVLAATAIASFASHAAVHWLKIRAGYGGYQRYGPEDQHATTVLHGSSLAYDGIDWSRISQVLGGAIESWATAGSSPAEWEYQRVRSPTVRRAIIVVSPYDLNEYWLCDFRADIVPVAAAIRDLQYCGPDGQLCKRILSQYPQMLVRELFPTAGRSDGVMVGIRASLYGIANRGASEDAEEGPVFGSGHASESEQALGDWPAARLQRRLALMRTGFQGRHWFAGPKSKALMRLLEQSELQGDTMIVVMPVSPTYRKEFLSPKVAEEFEEALAQLQARDPHLPLIRLDRLPTLASDAMFSDLVHLNKFGQEIATAAFVERLKEAAGR